MPIIKSAKKRVKQTAKKTEQRRPFKTRFLTLVKNVLKFCKGGEVEKAEKQLSATYSAIDTAAKRNIISKNTAANKKSLVQRTVSRAKSGEVTVEVKKSSVKKVAPKATAAKKTSTKKAPVKKAAPKKAAK